MGLISSLCLELAIAPEMLARIVGLPADRVARWGIGGVPPRHHSDFCALEDLIDMVRQQTAMPIRSAVRIGLPALNGRTILQMLEEQGPLFVLDRLRADASPQPSPAGGADELATKQPPAAESRSVA